MSLYDRVTAKPGGGRALAVARLRRSVLVALHRAFKASGLDSQSELAKRLPVRRSAVNQVFRGDGNVRINTLAEYLYEMGFEVNITLVRAGELRAAALENRFPMPALASASAFTSMTYDASALQATGLYWSGYAPAWRAPFLLACSHVTMSGPSLISARNELGSAYAAWHVFEPINLSSDLASSGAAS
jgi:hypothetical protein